MTLDILKNTPRIYPKGHPADQLPTLTAEGMKLGQARMTAIQPQLMQMIQDFAKSAAPAAAPPAKNTPQ